MKKMPSNLPGPPICHIHPSTHAKKMAIPCEESARESDLTSMSSPGLSQGSDSTSGTSKRSPSDDLKHFIKMKGTRKAECKICQKKLAYHGSMTNLRENLVKSNPLVYKQESPKQLSLQSCMRPKFCSPARTKAITEQ